MAGRSGFDERHLAALHGTFYVSTGLWPLLHRSSFERVTGPKQDFWLAQTVGVTVAAIGTGLVQASRAPIVSPELRTIACTGAAGLALVDLFFVARRRISAVYLLDAGVELALIGAWVVTRRRGGK